MSVAPKLKPHRRLWVLLAAGVLAAATLAYVWPFFIDDAFISFRYARNLSVGAGYGMNPDDVTDGVTGPFWLLPLVLAGLLGVSIPFAAKLLGATFALLSVMFLIRGMSGRASHGAREMSALFVAVTSGYWIWAVGGLETSLAALLMTSLVVACARPTHWSVPALALVILPAVRPELVPAALILGLGARSRRGNAAPGLSRIAACASLSAGVAIVSAFRFVAFGTPLPLSFIAKGGSLANGLTYVLSGALLLTAGGGVFLAWRATRRRRAARVVGLALIVHVGVVGLAGGDWMPGHRLFMPMVPALALLVGWGVTASRRAMWVAIPTLACLSLFGAWAAPESRSAGLRQAHRGAAIAADLEGGPVALLDAGYLGWRSGLEVVDLGGITDPMVARMPGDHVDRVIDVAYLEERAPSTFVLHSRRPSEIDGARLVGFDGYPTENRIVRSRWFARNYRAAEVYPYADGYWYVRFERVN